MLFWSERTRDLEEERKKEEKDNAETQSSLRFAEKIRFTTMLPFKVVYHDKYDLNLGPHVFPSQKFRLIAEALMAEKIADPGDFAKPDPATDEDILRVHTPQWGRKLKTGTLTASEVMLLEIPYSRELVD